MRYVRFMSSNELEKFKQGKVLRNNTDWSEKDSLSTYPPKMMMVTEYSIKEYSNKTMRLVRTGKVVDAFRRVIEWEDEPCCKK